MSAETSQDPAGDLTPGTNTLDPTADPRLEAPRRGCRSVTVVVPAYNEEASLAPTTRSLIATLDELGATFDLIIVDDGSRDETPRIADQLAADESRVTVVHQENRGIGGAFRTGIERAREEYVVLWPSDMPCEPQDVSPFLDAGGEADVIVGCRVCRTGYNPLMRFNAWLYPRLVRTLFRLRLRDVNWICLYRTDLVKRFDLTQNGIPMLTELLVKCRDAGATFKEIDVQMKPRSDGVASAARLRVMRRTLAGLFSFWWHWRRSR